MKIFKLLITLQTLIFFSIGYAMEQEKPVPPKEEELATLSPTTPATDLFNLLPDELLTEIILTVAKTETLEEAFNNIEKLTKVNQRLYNLINSEWGKKNLPTFHFISSANIKDITNEEKIKKLPLDSMTDVESLLGLLLKNKHIRAFFDRVAQEYQKQNAANTEDLPLKEAEIKKLMQLTDPDLLQDLLLPLLPSSIQRVQELSSILLSIQSNQDTLYSILVQLLSLLNKLAEEKENRLEKDPSFEPFLRNLVLVTGLLAKKVSPRLATSLRLENYMKSRVFPNYREYIPLLQQYGVPDNMLPTE